ncbi:MAG: hypothetical protein ACT452_05895, partial [Microthrixaceae bacterium]
SVAAKKKLSCKKLLKPTKIEAIMGAPVELTFQGGDSNSVAGPGQNSVFCTWSNDVGDEVSLSVYITDREGQFAFARETPVGGGSSEDVPDVGADAYFQLSSTGDAVAIWVLAPRASFSLANINIDKDQATLRTEQIELGKLVAKKLTG